MWPTATCMYINVRNGFLLGIHKRKMPQQLGWALSIYVYCSATKYSYVVMIYCVSSIDVRVVHSVLLLRPQANIH